jgi:hypothetical protein
MSHDRRRNTLPLLTPDKEVCTHVRAHASCACVPARSAEKRAGQDCTHLGAFAPKRAGGYTDAHSWQTLGGGVSMLQIR